MHEVLDIVALRSLTSIADSGGFRRAAEHLHLSQSAVSQHVRRLEHACGQALVERAGRSARFTEAGELLLSQARTILDVHDDVLARLHGPHQTQSTFTIGSTEHAADLLLPAISARLGVIFPNHTLRFRIDRGANLHERLTDGTIDAALLIGDVEGRRVRSAGVLSLDWYAAPGWRRPAGSPLPLVAIDEPCTIRRRALLTLSQNQVATTVICESGHLAGVVNAARAGLGVALLAHVGQAPHGLERRDDLPPVEPEPLHVRARVGAPAELVEAVATATAARLAPALAR